MPRQQAVDDFITVNKRFDKAPSTCSEKGPKENTVTELWKLQGLLFSKRMLRGSIFKK
jgi:hypothetical protein